MTSQEHAGVAFSKPSSSQPSFSQLSSSQPFSSKKSSSQPSSSYRGGMLGLPYAMENGGCFLKAAAGAAAGGLAGRGLMRCGCSLL